MLMSLYKSTCKREISMSGSLAWEPGLTDTSSPELLPTSGLSGCDRLCTDSGRKTSSVLPEVSSLNLTGKTNMKRNTQSPPTSPLRQLWETHHSVLSSIRERTHFCSVLNSGRSFHFLTILNATAIQSSTTQKCHTSCKQHSRTVVGRGVQSLH